MSQVQFSHNPMFCIDIIKTYKPDFTPRVAFILGSGLGALADQIENAVAISYEKLPGFPVSTVHGHAGGVSAGPSPGRTGGMYERSRTFLRRSWNDHYD
ncbi:purine-nucleoside phosphorylase [Escherichia coli]|nr:purine-nucleoside phosphorylase [Escherichia coli]STF15453.1 purine nucleoside phosphorylase [Escherichia coli]